MSYVTTKNSQPINKSKLLKNLIRKLEKLTQSIMMKKIKLLNKVFYHNLTK
jgi:hypothetical protein